MDTMKHGSRQKSSPQAERVAVESEQDDFDAFDWLNSNESPEGADDQVDPDTAHAHRHAINATPFELPRLEAPPSAASGPSRTSQTVHVELGRTRLNPNELLALETEVTIPLDTAADAPIALVIDGRPFAHADLVEVDGQLAVRIRETL